MGQYTEEQYQEFLNNRHTHDEELEAFLTQERLRLKKLDEEAEAARLKATSPWVKRATITNDLPTKDFTRSDR